MNVSYIYFYIVLCIKLTWIVISLISNLFTCDCSISTECVFLWNRLKFKYIVSLYYLLVYIIEFTKFIHFNVIYKPEILCHNNIFNFMRLTYTYLKYRTFLKHFSYFASLFLILTLWGRLKRMLYSPICAWRNWDPRRWLGFPKVTQFISPKGQTSCSLSSFMSISICNVGF